MDFYREAFSRNIGILTEAQQQKLRAATVAVAGAGGVGGLHVATLARMGVGKFRIADHDVFETANINRQYGATVHTLGRNKAETMAGIAVSINPEAQVSVFREPIRDGNVDAFLEGADAALDGIDFFAIDDRRRFFMRAREKGVPVVTAGPIGFGSALIVFSPGGMSFDEYFGIHDGMSRMEKLIAFAVGLAPSAMHLRYLDLSRVDLQAQRGPALASACALCAGLAATETVNLILGRAPILAAPHYFQFDPFLRRYKKGCLRLGGRNPFQKLKRWILMRRLSRNAVIGDIGGIKNSAKDGHA